MQRAMETAEILERVLGVPIVPDSRLSEYDVGDITGLTWKQVSERYIVEVQPVKPRIVLLNDTCHLGGEL